MPMRIAIIFLLPYLEMLITALGPQRELLDRDYLPHHWAWSNLTNMWGAGFGITSSLRVSLEVAGGATILVTLVTALIFTFIAAWNEFIAALTLTTQQLDHPADRPAGLVHRPVHGGLAAPVRCVPGGHHPGAHPVCAD